MIALVRGIADGSWRDESIGDHTLITDCTADADSGRHWPNGLRAGQRYWPARYGPPNTASGCMTRKAYGASVVGVSCNASLAVRPCPIEATLAALQGQRLEVRRVRAGEPVRRGQMSR
jgi:hypothetical protein